MAMPTTYTETTLAEFIHGELGTVASSLEWTVAGGSYDEAINSALAALDVSSISEVTGSSIADLRILAELFAWRRVSKHTAGDMDFEADGGSYKRSQTHAQAKSMMAMLEASVAHYTPGYQVVVERIDDSIRNPYKGLREEDRTL